MSTGHVVDLMNTRIGAPFTEKEILAGRKKETLPTENLLEDVDGCGSLRPSIYADVRCIDDVIAF